MSKKQKLELAWVENRFDDVKCSLESIDIQIQIFLSFFVVTLGIKFTNDLNALLMELNEQRIPADAEVPSIS